MKPLMGSRGEAASRCPRGGKITNKLGMSLKINKMVNGMVELD
jgi:hypothetical protein